MWVGEGERKEDKKDFFPTDRKDQNKPTKKDSGSFVQQFLNLKNIYVTVFVTPRTAKIYFTVNQNYGRM